MVYFVSKRLQRAAAALLCLMAIQIGLAVADVEPAATPLAVPIAIGR
jgi:hypothetical protein